MRPISRLFATVVLAAAAWGGAVAESAAAVSPSIKKAMWGPLEQDGRSQFPIYRHLGVGIFETTLKWSAAAPTRPAQPSDPADPAYRWPRDLDRTVAEARRSKIRVSILLADTPAWANGGRPGNWVPGDPRDLARFASAAARRYPSVRLWMVLGEPSRQPNFMPLVPEDRGKTRLTPAQAAAPRYYARMLDATYAALKRVRRSNLVIGGNTYTVGDISPYNWIRYLRLPNGRPPRMDLYGHNPFTARRPNLRNPPPPPGPDVNYSDFSDLDTLVRLLDRNIRDPKGKPLRLFLSEFHVPTDHPNHEFPFWVTRKVQADWVAAALRIARRWDRIYTLGWFTLYDEAPRSDGREVNRGLIDNSGTRKPAYWAYRRG